MATASAILHGIHRASRLSRRTGRRRDLDFAHLPSPMADFGYDVADYCDIDPIFGTLAGLRPPACRGSRRGLKVILDFVPNHTSDQHPWFLEEPLVARQSETRLVPLARPSPEQLAEQFRRFGWEYDETTGQYYYHSFLKEQPDLNWRNPEVAHAMFDSLTFLAAIAASMVFASMSCGC